MVEPITIALADDHPALRRGMIDCLVSHGRFNVVFEAANGKDFLHTLRQAAAPPDICILDLSMPELDGFETMKAIRREFPKVRVLVYSMYLDEYNILRIYQNGGAGAFSKQWDLDEIAGALIQVFEEGIYIPPAIGHKVREAIKKYNTKAPMLSQRELEYLKLYLEDLSYKEIADKMGIRVKTVDSYRENICNKLKIYSKVGLILFALKTGIVGWQI